MVKTKLIEFQKIEESAVKPKEVKLEPKETSEEKKKSVKKEGNKKSHQSVRVDLERIDKLMNMVSELVLSSSVSAPSITKLISLFNSTDISLIILGNLLNTVSKGSILIFITKS